MNKELLLLLTPVAFCHALGHVMSNVSFAAVAVSFTHTIKGIKHFLHCFYLHTYVLVVNIEVSEHLFSVWLHSSVLG